MPQLPYARYVRALAQLLPRTQNTLRVSDYRFSRRDGCPGYPRARAQVETIWRPCLRAQAPPSASPAASRTCEVSARRCARPPSDTAESCLSYWLSPQKRGWRNWTPDLAVYPYPTRCAGTGQYRGGCTCQCHDRGHGEGAWKGVAWRFFRVTREKP